MNTRSPEGLCPPSSTNALVGGQSPVFGQSEIDKSAELLLDFRVEFMEFVIEISVSQSDMASKKKSGVVQVKNPRTKRYVKIDRDKGKIVSHKKSPGPYKDVPIARKKK